jgi:glutathione synthase/RimK-type ligase-like ATP-grasp enzyme
MPYRYLVGINRIKNSNIKPIDIIQYNSEYYITETNALVKGIKFIKNNINIKLDDTFVDKWISKNIN